MMGALNVKPVAPMKSVAPAASPDNAPLEDIFARANGPAASSGTLAPITDRPQVAMTDGGSMLGITEGTSDV